MLAEVICEDGRWEAAGLDAMAETAARAALGVVGLDPQAFVLVVMGCDDARIAGLNADFRGKPQPTNVLSWPSEERGAQAPGGQPDLPEGDADDPEELGDIAIAWETCAREAAEAGKSFHDHATHLIVHATLHLLGYDHIRDEDAALMEGLEVRALAGLGISDPY
jgi:probable rRNA maturation factor